MAKAVAGTSVEFTIKLFSQHNYGWASFLALIANHAGDTKYRAIVKYQNNLLQKIKWNGRSYPLEQHVSNNRTAVNDLRECYIHIGNAVPNFPQQVEYLLESTLSQDNTLHAAMGNIHADTNGLCSDFEAASIHLIEVDTYTRSSNTLNKNRQDNVYSVTFSGRGQTCVDLRWNNHKESRKLSDSQKDELTSWKSSNAGKSSSKKQQIETKTSKRGLKGNLLRVGGRKN